MPKFRKIPHPLAPFPRPGEGETAANTSPHPLAAAAKPGEGEKAVQPTAPQPAAEASAGAYPRYPAYKDSGVEWLGEVPEHWTVTRIKNAIADARNGVWGDEPSEENSILCVRVADFNRQNFGVNLDNPTYRGVAEKDRIGRSLQRNDLLLEKSGGGENQPVGFVVIYEHDELAVSSNFVARLVLKTSSHPRFLLYSFAKLYGERVNVRSIKQNTGIQNLDAGQYFDELITLPPLPEQRAIADFLDGETARIDALVAKQEALIALLQEKRKAVISHAVTKGLNADAPMKESGVAWLGEVPAEWRTATLKHLVSIPITDGPHETPIFLDEGVPFLSAEAVKNGKLDFNLKRGYISSELHNLYTKKCQPMLDDIFMVKSGNTTGNIAIVETDEIFAIWSPLALIRCNSTMILPRYLYLFMQSQFFQTNVNLSASYGTQPNIGMGVIENLPVTYYSGN